MTGEKKAAATRYHRKALMTAADRLFTEFGYDGMNMNMLAKEAGYSKATVYVYFRSKDEIVRELCIERLKLLRSELALVLKSDITTDEKFAEINGILKELAIDDATYFDFVTSKFDGKVTDGDRDDGTARLKDLVYGIVEDLTALTDIGDLKRRWFEFYGRIKTSKMFDNYGNRGAEDL